MPYEIGFPMILTSGAFLTTNPINKPAMNYRRILIAAVFILYMQWTVKNMTSWRRKTPSASAIRKQISRCRIHFPHELTCQILTDQSIKIRRRAYCISLYVRAKQLVFHLSPRYGHVIIVSGCLILTAVKSFSYGWLT